MGFLSNSGAVTTDLTASDGITLTSGNPVTVKPGQTPVQLVPTTTAEKSYENQHPEISFGFWPGPVIADPARGRVLVFYGKLCRRGAEGTTCSGPMGKGLGTGIAAIDMNSGRVTRLSARATVTSVEGTDPTLFFPAGTGFSSASVVVGGDVYVYGDCNYGCGKTQFLSYFNPGSGEQRLMRVDFS